MTSTREDDRFVYLFILKTEKIFIMSREESSEDFKYKRDLGHVFDAVQFYEAVYREHYQRDLVSEYVIDNYSHTNYILVIVDSDKIISRQ